jgi:predicted protein tyrosine phosphatase
MNSWFDIIPMSQVGHRIFVSGMAACAELEKDNPYRITAVLNVHNAPDVHLRSDISYMHVPFNDGEDIPQEQFTKCLGWLKAMFDDGHTICIHCLAGISRSVTITASFMHYTGLMGFEEALHQIKTIRPAANPAPAIVLSAKRMLGVWPYNGDYGTIPEHEKTIADSFIWMDAFRLAQVHTKDDCPMKMFLLANDPNDNRPRHEIPCTCETLNTKGV